MVKQIAIATVLAATAVVSVPNAQARGFVGFTVGGPLVAPVPVYPPPPVYYAYPPPPVAYPVPPPAAYSAPPPSGASPTCREYQSTVNIGGRSQTSVGTACLQPDGSWRIVQ